METQEFEIESIGPGSETANAARVDGKTFIEELTTKGLTVFLTHLVKRGNDYLTYEVFCKPSEGKWLKTDSVQIDYSREETALVKLYNLGFRLDREDPNTKDDWSVYKKTTNQT